MKKNIIIKKFIYIILISFITSNLNALNSNEANELIKKHSLKNQELILEEASLFKIPPKEEVSNFVINKLKKIQPTSYFFNDIITPVEEKIFKSNTLGTSLSSVAQDYLKLLNKEEIVYASNGENPSDKNLALEIKLATANTYETCKNRSFWARTTLEEVKDDNTKEVSLKSTLYFCVNNAERIINNAFPIPSDSLKRENLFFQMITHELFHVLYGMGECSAEMVAQFLTAAAYDGLFVPKFEYLAINQCPDDPTYFFPATFYYQFDELELGN